MSVIAKAIADRQSEIERLQVEIKALNDVDKILGTSAPPAKPAARRSSSRRTAAAATPVAETPPDAKPTRKRRTMSAEEKVFVYRVEARKSAKWCAGLVRMCRYVQYGSRGRQTGRFEGARARG